MKQRIKCPHCGGLDTERQMFDENTDGIIEVRTCDECGSEYLNHLVNDHQEVTHPP